MLKVRYRLYGETLWQNLIVRRRYQPKRNTDKERDEEAMGNQYINAGRIRKCIGIPCISAGLGCREVGIIISCPVPLQKD